MSEAPRDVVVGYCYGPDGKVTQPFSEALRDLQRHDEAGPRRLLDVLSIGGLYIAKNRNDLAAIFLQSKARWLLFFDDDMVFGPDIIDVMLSVADAAHLIVGALYFGYGPGENIYPIRLDEREDGLTYLSPSLELGTLRETAAVGMGCTIIHRSVLAALGEEPFGHGTYEDVEFCKNVRRHGFAVWHYTGVSLGHVKRHLVTFDTFMAQPGVTQRREVDYA